MWHENALGFSLNFNSSVLQFLSVAPGGASSPNASLVMNTNDPAAGRVGIALALPAGTTFNAGTQDVLQVTFRVAAVLSPVTVPVTFGDVPTVRQVANGQAQPLPAVFTTK